MRKYYSDQCELQLQGLELPSDILESVKVLITATPGHFPALNQIAQQLSMSERTLRRKLKQQDTSYREIIDQIKQDKAKEFLKEGKLSVEQIAHILSYSDAANFRRAFYKWTQLSPSQYRQQLKL